MTNSIPQGAEGGQPSSVEMMTNDELMEAIARAMCDDREARVIADKLEAPCFDEQDDETREFWRRIAAICATTLRDLGPSEEMVEAAAATPGMKAASAAMTLHQGRGFGFPEGSFADGSPLHQAHRAMLTSLIGDTPNV